MILIEGESDGNINKLSQKCYKILDDHSSKFMFQSNKAPRALWAVWAQLYFESKANINMLTCIVFTIM